MIASSGTVVSRRAVLRGTGALIVSCSLGPAITAAVIGRQQTANQAALPGDLAQYPLLDSWLRIAADGKVTAFTGKAELGQGIRTALLQVIAEELLVPLDRVTLITADTALTPNEGYTSGSHSMQDSGTALRNAAAQVREILLAEAANRLQQPIAQLQVEDGAVVAPDGTRLTYGNLVADQLLHVRAQPTSKLRNPAAFKIMGQSTQRVDIPAKVCGDQAYMQDMRLPGMLHARVVRPPGYGANLLKLDTAAVEKMPGVVKVLRDKNFLAVVAHREYQAVKAMRALAALAQWAQTASLPQAAALHATLLAMKSEDETILDTRSGGTRATHSATYTRPYLAHGSIGPSCAIAQWSQDQLTLWSSTQGVFPNRAAIAELLRLDPQQVRCIQVEGSGCYGHNGADDASADAALIAKAIPDHPIRLQWMREQEHAWEPYGPAMIAKVRASLDESGHIDTWDYGVWSNTHSTRPGPAGALLAAREIAAGYPPPEPRPIPQPEGGGDRNAIPLYEVRNAHVVHHFLPQMPLRVSALRSLGAYLNVIAIEGFMDELAELVAADPVDFRLKHLNDPRAVAVIKAAAEDFQWASRPKRSPGQGHGVGFARYKNLAAYCAVIMEVTVDHETGRTRVVRAVAAVDTGQVVNPNGVVNQIQGSILQSMSWTLFEGVTFDTQRITSVDWASYPILRFSSVPATLSVRLLDAPGAPFLGCGEAGQGPAAAALVNAVANATGRRIRDLPLTPGRVKAAIGV